PFEIYLNGVSPKPSMTYSISNGTLPDGLMLDSVSGRIYGTPTEVASNYQRSVTIMATTGTKTATTTITFDVFKNRAPVFQTDRVLGSGLGGGYFEREIVATDEDREKLTYRVASGSVLPATLRLEGNVLSGTLPVALEDDVTSRFTLEVTDGHNTV